MKIRVEFGEKLDQELRQKQFYLLPGAGAHTLGA